MKRIAPAVVLLALVMMAYALLAGRTRTIFDETGDFGRVRVTERADGLRALVTGDGRARQSAIYPGRPLHLELAYSRVGMIGLALLPRNAHVLFVGLGGGAMPMYAHRILPAAHIEVAEIDPLIVDVAREYFAFAPDSLLVVHTGDGRAFIERTVPDTYDLIVLDAFSDDEVPFALTTKEFLEAVRASLATGGVVVSNLWSRSPAYPSMLATYDAVFPQVHLLRVSGHAQYILLAAGDARPLDEESMVDAARSLAERADLGFDLARLVVEGYERVPPVPAPVLTDSAVAARSL